MGLGNSKIRHTASEHITKNYVGWANIQLIGHNIPAWIHEGGIVRFRSHVDNTFKFNLPENIYILLDIDDIVWIEREDEIYPFLITHRDFEYGGPFATTYYIVVNEMRIADTMEHKPSKEIQLFNMRHQFLLPWKIITQPALDSCIPKSPEVIICRPIIMVEQLLSLAPAVAQTTTAIVAYEPTTL